MIVHLSVIYAKNVINQHVGYKIRWSPAAEFMNCQGFILIGKYLKLKSGKAASECGPWKHACFSIITFLNMESVDCLRKARQGA